MTASGPTSSTAPNASTRPIRPRTPVPGPSPASAPSPAPGPAAAQQQVPDFLAGVPDLITGAPNDASGTDDAGGRIGPEELDAALDAAAAAHRGLQAHLQGDQRA